MRTRATLHATATLTAVALVLGSVPLHAKVIKVAPSGAVDAIQNAVDAAQPGDTVMVAPGTYWAGDNQGVYIGPEKTGLKLKAAGQPGSVKIVKAVGLSDDSAKGIWIMADDVLVEGFDISGFWSGVYGGGGVSQAQGGRIVRNLIHDCVSEGIILSGSSDFDIGHNTVEGAATGIILNGANTRIHIHNNRVTASQGDGIRVANSPGCVLDHNVCENNEWDGIYLAESPDCIADHNRSCNNAWEGIAVGRSPRCTVTNNETCNNGTGIIVWCSCGTRFERNLAAGNSGYDLAVGNCEEEVYDPTCNSYSNNHADTAYPSLEIWDVTLP